MIHKFIFSIGILSLLIIYPMTDVNGLELTGNFIQGGLATGVVPPGTTVIFEGRKLTTSPQGRFVIGFDRDAPQRETLILQFTNGTRQRHQILVKKRSFQIERIDGLAPRKVNPTPADLKRIRQEAELVRKARRRNDPRTFYMQSFIWPVVGRITGVYGSQRILNGTPRTPHYGIDIATPLGTPVKAPAGGVITLVHPNMFYSGGTIILDHGQGVSSSFLHLQKILVSRGQTVDQGQIIALVGATGRATGPHLDWRMNWFDKRIDPSLLVPEMPLPKKGHVK